MMEYTGMLSIFILIFGWSAQMVESPATGGAPEMTVNGRNIVEVFLALSASSATSTTMESISNQKADTSECGGYILSNSHSKWIALLIYAYFVVVGAIYYLYITLNSKNFRKRCHFIVLMHIICSFSQLKIKLHQLDDPKEIIELIGNLSEMGGALFNILQEDTFRIVSIISETFINSSGLQKTQATIYFQNKFWQCYSVNAFYEAKWKKADIRNKNKANKLLIKSHRLFNETINSNLKKFKHFSQNDQEAFDIQLRSIFPRENIDRFIIAAIVATSVAFLQAGAQYNELTLVEYVQQLLESDGTSSTFPSPIFNMVNTEAMDGGVAIEDPNFSSVKETLNNSSKIYQGLKLFYPNAVVARDGSLVIGHNLEDILKCFASTIPQEFKITDGTLSVDNNVPSIAGNGDVVQQNSGNMRILSTMIIAFNNFKRQLQRNRHVDIQNSVRLLDLILTLKPQSDGKYHLSGQDFTKEELLEYFNLYLIKRIQNVSGSYTSHDDDNNGSTAFFPQFNINHVEKNANVPINLYETLTAYDLIMSIKHIQTTLGGTAIVTSTFFDCGATFVADLALGSGAKKVHFGNIYRSEYEQLLKLEKSQNSLNLNLIETSSTQDLSTNSAQSDIDSHSFVVDINQQNNLHDQDG